ncbi:hypothetical protein B0I08_10161 [Glaciihabitans tibetensis]|uniref:Uncharacterized protein n=1 Tax=Glaciihabitans tibetensis TaxID=1266600 RepID=A0A2T0VI78_9MICO|nr:MFS transporter [Glaciihabitans tibetensis]PRY69939.1 hypothetical protein B0I08_10161 [Glaciihabitans tibetensis]
MSYRRLLYLGQFVAAVVLPTWVLVSRGILADGVGWELLVYLFACPALFLSMVVVGALINARVSVRSIRAVSWRDASLLTVWYLAIVAYGLWAFQALAVAVVLLSIAAFWVSAWTLFRETRARFRGIVADFERAAQPPGAAGPTVEPRRIIVINPDEKPR